MSVLGSIGSAFGGASLGAAVVEVGLDTRKLTSGLAGARKEVDAATTGAEKRSAAFSAAWVSGAALAGAAIIKFGADSVRAFSESQQVMAQTEAVLKSTGGTANVTAAQIQDYAATWQELTGIQDEAIQGSANLLLTFRDVRNEVGAGNDIFTQAQTAILDMATAINQGALPTMEQLKSTTLQMGKALNDPVAGMTALKRAGVSFNAEQREMIEGLVESGDLLGAQKVILAEVTSEFGGAAKAAGGTFAGSMAKVAAKFDDLQEAVGEKLVPTLETFIDVAGFAVDHIEEIGLALAGLATFKAIQALPMLFTNVAMGLMKLGAPIGLANISSIGGALEGLAATGPALGATAVAIGAVYTAVKILSGADPTFVPELATFVEENTAKLPGFTLEMQHLAQESAKVRGSMTDLAQVGGGALGSLGQAASGLIGAFQRSGSAARNFAGMSGKELKAFRDDAASSIQDVIGSLDSVEAKWHGTAQAGLRAMQQMAENAGEVARAFKKLDKEAVPEKFKAFLLQQGPAAVAQFVSSTAKQKGKWLAAWREYESGMENSIQNMKGIAARGGTEVGQALGQGLASAVNGAIQQASAAATNAINSMVAAMREAAQTHSPSKKTMEIGEEMIQGLIVGLDSEDDALVEKAETTIEKLTAAMEKELDRLNQRVGAKLDEMKNELQDALAVANDFRSSIISGFGSFLDISQAFSTTDAEGNETAPTAASVGSFFTQQVASATQFASVLEALKAQGASADLLSNIASSGPDAVGFAQALLQGGPDLIAQANSAYTTINGLAQGTAKGLSEDYFGQKIDELKDEYRQARQEYRQQTRLMQQAIDILSNQKLELLLKPGGQQALEQLILSVIQKNGLARSSL